jgi:hypothetical protein
MKHLTTALALGAAAIGLAAPASPALAAEGSTLNLSGPTNGTVGQPMTFQVSGNNPFDPQYLQSFAFAAGVISTRVVQACPANRDDGTQIAINSGGDLPVNYAQERIDWNGNFSQTFAYTPRQPGRWLMCAYTVDLTGYTLASAALTLDIGSTQPNHSGGGSRPPSPPAYTIQGIHDCRALLTGSHAKACIRDVVRRASTRCRRLHSQPARTRCLQAVRRAARSGT